MVYERELRERLEFAFRDKFVAIEPVTTWIDTAFHGHLVLPLQMMKDLELESLAQT
jgi:predicted aspartyl protease